MIVLQWLVCHIRKPQILRAKCRHYIQLYPLDHLPAKIISQKLPDVYVIHIVRDPRTFVPSYMNWMHSRFKSYVANKLVPGWHPSGSLTGEIPSPVWRKMDEFQRVCWHWSYKNAFLERAFDGYSRYRQVYFEDLFSDRGPEVLRSTLSTLGITYRDEFEIIFQQRKNRSKKRIFPNWARLAPYNKRQLLEICGTQMKQYGYASGDNHAGLHPDDVVSSL